MEAKQSISVQPATLAKIVAKEALRQVKEQTPECTFAIAPDDNHVNYGTNAHFEAIFVAYKCALAANIATKTNAVPKSAQEVDTATNLAIQLATIAPVAPDAPRLVVRIHECIADEFSGYMRDVCKYSTNLHKLPFSATTIQSLAELLYGGELHLTPGGFHELILAVDYLSIKHNIGLLVNAFFEITASDEQRIQEQVEFIMLGMFSNDFPEYALWKHAYIETILEFTNVEQLSAEAIKPFAPTYQSYKPLREAIHTHRDHGDTLPTMVILDIIWLMTTKNLFGPTVLELLHDHYIHPNILCTFDAQLDKIVSTKLSSQFYIGRLHSIQKYVVGFAKWRGYRGFLSSGSTTIMSYIGDLATDQCKELFGEAPEMPPRISTPFCEWHLTDRVPMAGDGQVLVADSSMPSGTYWANTVPIINGYLW